MESPYIDPRTSILVAEVGKPFAFQLAAFGDPSVWTALHLPAGFSISDTTGLISASNPSDPGLYQIAVRASNDGGHDQIFLLLSVLDAEVEDERMGGWNDLLLDFDLTTRRVSIHGRGADGDQPAALFPVSPGNSFDLLIGFYRDGVLCDLNPNAEAVAVKLALKEFEPELLISLEGGEAEKVVAGDSVRYRIGCYIDPEKWRPLLTSYESDMQTLLEAPSELELSVGRPYYTQMKSTSPFTLQGGMTGEYGTGPVMFRTLVFTDLQDQEQRSYRLAVALAVTGRPLQRVEIEQTFQVEFAGGLWTVTDIDDGYHSATGPIEGTKWIPTMEITAIEGDSGGVDVDVRISTSSDNEGLYAFDFSVLPYKAPYVNFDLRDPMAVLSWNGPWYLAVAAAANDSSFITNSGMGAFSEVREAHGTEMTTMELLTEGIMHAYCDSRTLSDYSPEFVGVDAIGQYEVRVWIQATSPVRNMFFTPSTPPQDWSSDWPGSFPSASPGIGLTTSAVVSGTLVQTDGIRRIRYTGQFKTEIVRGMVPER